MNFNLKARINRSDGRGDPAGARPTLCQGPPSGKADEFLVEAEIEAACAEELNRALLSALRKVN